MSRRNVALGSSFDRCDIRNQWPSRPYAAEADTSVGHAQVNFDSRNFLAARKPVAVILEPVPAILVGSGKYSERSGMKTLSFRLIPARAVLPSTVFLVSRHCLAFSATRRWPRGARDKERANRAAQLSLVSARSTHVLKGQIDD